MSKTWDQLCSKILLWLCVYVDDKPHVFITDHRYNPHSVTMYCHEQSRQRPYLPVLIGHCFKPTLRADMAGDSYMKEESRPRAVQKYTTSK